MVEPHQSDNSAKSEGCNGSSSLSPATTTSNINIMDKNLLKENIGEFFSKMYDANKGRKLEVTLRMSDNQIVIYNKSNTDFQYINIVDRNPSVDEIVESISM